MTGMGQKLDQFKVHASNHGQTVTLSPWSAWPSGAYSDPWSGEPDPDNVGYPATQPETTYGTSVSVVGFFQHWRANQEKRYVRTPWGEETEIMAIFFCPGDQTIAVRDKVVFGSETYWVTQLQEWRDGADLVHVEAILVQSVPRAT
jgi:hypothetical protein